MVEDQSPIDKENEEMFKAGEAFRALAKNLLLDINNKEIKLFDLPANKRIFLFILTRAMKTFAAIEILCQNGYGQDVAALLRSLMENFITVRYITHDPLQADDLARRFVEYKWILFRRSLAEEEFALRETEGPRWDEFQKRKSLILKNVEEFKKKYHVISDKSLLTWSGKTLKDMARHVSKDLMHEYESTFRLCSRFSHPTILGDSEYIIQDDQTLTFSALPTRVGVTTNYRSALRFFAEFVCLVNTIFTLERDGEILTLKDKHQNILSQITADENTPPQPPDRSTPLRELKIFFKV